MGDLANILTHFEKGTSAVCELDFESIVCAVNILRYARMEKKRVWLVGNGGSASTASHFANDLRKMCAMDVVSLPNDIPSILAYGNDNGWENMFADAMSPFNNGDVLIAISCSGASPNVIFAAQKAEKFGGHVIALTGEATRRNELMLLAHPAILVPAQDIKVQEDIHLMVCHAIAGALSE